MSTMTHPRRQPHRRTGEPVLGPRWYAKQGLTVLDSRDDRQRDLDPARYVIDITVWGGLDSCYQAGDNRALVPSSSLAALVLDSVKGLAAAGSPLNLLGPLVTAQARQRYPELPEVSLEVQRHPLSLFRRTAAGSIHLVHSANSIEIWTSPTTTSRAQEPYAGIERLAIVLAGQHSFAGFLTDELCSDTPRAWRVLVGELTARWSTNLDRGAALSITQVRREILGELARASTSVQELLTSVATRVLQRRVGIDQVTLEFRSFPTIPLAQDSDGASPIVQLHPGPVAVTSVTVAQSAFAHRWGLNPPGQTQPVGTSVITMTDANDVVPSHQEREC